jgi:hypothetical protein
MTRVFLLVSGVMLLSAAAGAATPPQSRSADGRRNFRSSLMSNTKWHGLLEAVRGASIDIRQVVIKFIDRQDIAAMRRVIEATGKRFPLEDTPAGLRVIGHVR